ncbi:MAG: DEAD/DEAH box helicase family protein, partial [Candidatus Marinimicrobia bacterium]|nr:DEAD/DEAH box helicase family protein [Candidatus Neomarinimicrobiota bacterium]
MSSYQVFSYKVPDHLKSKVTIGLRVMAPVRNRKVQGIIVAIKDASDYKGNIREVDSLVDEFPVLDNQLWNLILWLADYYNTPLGVAAKAALPANLSTKYEPRSQLFVKAKTEGEPLATNAKSQIALLDYLSDKNEFIPASTLSEFASNPIEVSRKLAEKGWVELLEKPVLPDLTGLSLNPIYKNVRFTEYQDKALDKLKTSMDGDEFSPFLLHGVTGSGKTEIYIEAARHGIKQNKSIIMLLPEIALTPQIAGRFRAAFGDDVALWHSKLSQSARAWTWKKICAGDYKVVVGARSAIFAPLKNLGLVVVDEEQENAYKQDSP